MAVALVVGAWELGQGAWIHARAWVAQALLKRAWVRTAAGETRVKPWPWADTWPVARIEIPRLGKSAIAHGPMRYVLHATMMPALSRAPSSPL